ncbi:hypothetical protein [Helcococcus kunzii]
MKIENARGEMASKLLQIRKIQKSNGQMALKLKIGNLVPNF